MSFDAKIHFAFIDALAAFCYQVGYNHIVMSKL
jgi:hypothetical protein